jgi:large repetitive protein
VTVVNPSPTKHATTTTVTNLNPGSVHAGDPYAINVTVSSAAGTPTGTVVVAPTKPSGLPSSYSCAVTLVDGAGSCNVTPGAGTFGDIFYEATYAGDSTHTGSTSTGTHELIVPETTTTSVAPATATHGSVALTTTVVGQDKGNISPSAGGTGTVTFTVTQGTTTIGTCNKAGLTYDGGGANLATCTLTLAAGSYSVEAVYSGDLSNLTSTGTETLVVS